jgi:hypothetical protein
MEKEYELVDLQGERRRLLQGYSRYGYTPQTALADLIDNSIGANAERIRIDISEQVDGSNKVYIIDDGIGMTPERLKSALAPGSPSDIQNSQLSKFGFGMKTASLEISPMGFSVLTRSDETGQLCAASIFVDDQSGTGAIQARFWSTSHINETWIAKFESLAGPGGHGTMIIWEEADLKEADIFKSERGTKEQTRRRIENRITQHIGTVFHRWIEGTNSQNQKVNITFQGVAVEPWNPLDPMYLDSEQVEEVPLLRIQDDLGGEVALKLTPWVMKKGLSQAVRDGEARKSNKYQGIYLYRLDRIINNPQWFEISPNKRNGLNGLRFALEIDSRLDDLLHLDVKKSTVDLPDEIVRAIGPYVSQYIKREEERSHTGKAAGNKTKTPMDALESASRKYKDLDLKAPTVRPERQSPTDVITTNVDGTKLPLHIKELPSSLKSDKTIHLVSAHETKGYLWEPRTARDLSMQVLVNEDHDFYQKVMLPSGQDAYEGFIWLLIAFSRAELATQYSDFKMQFSHMRRHMSETLESYSEELEMPDLGEVDE